MKSLFNRSFVSVVFAQIASLFGDAVLRFALPLYVLNLTGVGGAHGSGGRRRMAALHRAYAYRRGGGRPREQGGSWPCSTCCWP